jgi:uncharacterized protein (DUF433 family)
MTATQIFNQGSTEIPNFPINIWRNYPHIISDPEIHSGWPSIKGTRIIATDILRSQIEGYTLDAMLMEFKQLGAKVTKEMLQEAIDFSIDWLHFLKNEKTSNRASR